MNKATSRRALLQVGALSSVVAASGLALPALARDTKKTGAEEAISPPEDLMREHAILDRILLIYEAGMRRAGQGEDIDPGRFRTCRRHRARLHPRLSREVRGGADLPALQDGRPHGRAGQRAGRPARAPDASSPNASSRPRRRPAIASRARRWAATSRPSSPCIARTPRARRPTSSPPCASSSPADEYEGIADEMEKRERQAFGADGFEKVAKKVAEIETVIGIHDLDVFTPKSSREASEAALRKIA